MKNLKFKWLLLSFILSIASLNTAWAVTYNPSGVAQQTMQSQQVMQTGGAYNGTVYEPFSNTTPSEANGPAKVPGGPRRAGWYDENGDYHTDEGEYYTGGEDKPSSQSPVGEPWIMALFALGFVGVIAIRQYKRKTVKSMSMKNSTGKFVATLALLCTLGVGQMWAKGYSSKSFVYLEINGTTKYYEISTDTWPTDISLPGTWGGVLSSQSLTDIHSLKVVGGAIGGWTNSGESLSATLSYAVTNSSDTPASWTSFNSIAANNKYRTSGSDEDKKQCFYYKNDGSTDITPAPGNYYLHIKIEDENSGSHTSNVAFTVHRYTVAGSETVLGSDWSAIDTNNDMVYTSGTTYTLTKSNVALNSGTTYSFKVVKDQDWNNAYPKDNKTFTVDATAHYNVTFTFDASNNSVSEAVATRLYAVEYNGNGSTSGSVATTYHLSGASVTVAAQGSLTKSNYSFGGWNTANDASGTNYTAGSGSFTMGSSDKTLYAKWTQGTTVNANGDGSNSTYTATWNNGSITIASAPSRTGYRLNGYYAESGCSNKIAATNGVLESDVEISSTTWTNASGKWAHTAAAATIYAGWDANTYTVHFNGNGSDGGSTDDEAFTYGTAKTLTANGFTRTGYTFAGWNTEANGSGSSYTNGQSVSNLTSTHEGTVNLHAQWTANTYTITLDGDEPNKDNAGTYAAGSVATFDAACPSLSGTLPTAANGYHFMGFYSLQNGDGVKVIDEDGNWVASADGYTDASTHWVHADDATLYAYFKKAEVTEIAFTAALVANETTAEAEITVSPSPVGTTKICFKLLYNSGAELADQPTFTYNAGTRKVTFTAPSTPGSYKLQVTLRTGSSCDGGTMLDTEDESFTVAGPNVVTIKYMYGDTKTEVNASTTVEGDPLNWTEVSVGTASDDPIGYTFSTWELGDGMTLKDGDALTDRTIQFKSTYNATLKAKYNKKNLIYFYNNLGWEDVYVYFYTSDGYWSANYGTGAYKGKKFDSKSPFWDMHYGQMTQIEGTNIWYFDYTARGWDGWRYIAFANMDKANSGSDDTGNNELGFFANTTANPIEVIRRGDHYTALPMYVPYNSESSAQLKNDNKAKYFFQGFWMNYPESTGLAIRIYDSKKGDGIHGSYIREVPFELPVDKAIPMSFKTDLEGNKTYGFKLVRHGSSDEWFSNGGTMSNGHSGVGGDLWDFKSAQNSDCGLTTSSAGEYEFSLSFGLDATSNYNFLVGVKFPEATGDYRVMYKDDETESGEWFVSHVIPRLLNKDTVSFFVRPKAHPKMKMQKCTASWSGSATTVTWTDTITEATNMLASMPAAITAGGDGVYYFCMNKGEDGKRVMGDVAAYEGQYYIRTDAAPSQWDNYRNTDHKMTYSEYAEEYNRDPAYTHYYMKYATIGTNVKFVVANDYSPYISDTLKGGDHVNMSSHTLNANANIRFMWDRRNNNVGREFIAPAQNNGSRFLVMQGEAEKLLAPNGTALDGYDEAHPGNNKGGGLNAIQFTDKQDWIYTADVKAVPGGRIKLYKSYDGGTHYVYGDGADSFTGDHAIELISGTGGATPQTIRAVYDFKTNRLMAAWVPADTIKSAQTVNADIMIVREHQEAASNIVLQGSGNINLTEGKMIYGVMRFNRYTLNNREKTGAHGFLPIANWKSQYERSLYYISFPFDVKINEIFGIGEYGKHWIMQRYRGDQRAQKGFWIDSGSYWKFMGPDMTLNANEGYILTLDLNKFEYNLTGEGEIWHNGVEEIELYFPASEAVNITQVSDFELPALDSTIYKCTINRGDGTDGDRRIKDSYWRCIGVPSFADYSGVVKDSDEVTITWKTDGLPFLYDINWADKSITAYSGKNFPFKAMHAYLIQNGSNIHWSNVYTYQPSPAVGAPRRSKEELSELEFRLEINQQDSMIDQTYVRLSEEEGVTNEFDFGQDMSKEFNAGANIYTFIGYEQVAGNSMPFSNQTTTVPVGVKIATDGDYTFALPEGTEGVGVVLIDNIASTRTNLALEDYTINLATGIYDGRFFLEISPIVQSPTDIEQTSSDSKDGVRKVMVDGILYIVKDGRIYDATGTRVQ